MAEIIQLWEFQQARRRVERRNGEQHLERALALMRDNLADAADDLRDAPAPQQLELLNRIDHLTSMIRYGMRMLSETEDSGESTTGERHR
jgi:hypothetical protein